MRRPNYLLWVVNQLWGEEEKEKGKGQKFNDERRSSGEGHSLGTCVEQLVAKDVGLCGQPLSVSEVVVPPYESI